MTAPDQEHPPESASDGNRHRGWVRFVAIVYRALLILGLLLIVAAVVLVFFTGRTYLWVAAIPLGVIALGVLLADVEYRLYKRVNHPQDQEPPQNKK